MKEKIIGVLGGMGPESTAELLARITRSTPAATEQEHLRVIIDSNPKIPNRTDSLLSGESKAIIEALGQTACNLERAGAEVLCIPCNTAHAYLADVRTAVDIPVLDMIDEAARTAREAFGEGVTVGLLATDGTIRSRLYHDALTNHGLIGMAPTMQGVQNAVMDALETVKLHGVSEDVYRVLAVAMRDLVGQGATVMIAGCTEISLVFERFSPEIPWIDPLQVLAEAVVREAMAEKSGSAR